VCLPPVARVDAALGNVGVRSLRLQSVLGLSLWLDHSVVKLWVAPLTSTMWPPVSLESSIPRATSHPGQ
jgi:hypothetical protein